MENRIYILRELREISPVVAEIGNQNPYTVPAGYFEGLADRLLLHIQADETPVLPQAVNPYEVPQGYFEGLADKLLQHVKGNETTLSPALQQANNNPYQVPQDYFEALADQLLQRVKESEISLSPALQQANNNPYQVPEGYFNNLPATILNRIKADQTDSVNEELEILSPLLSGIGKKTPFSTPAGYFDELSDNAVAGAQAIEFVNGELENLSPLMNSLRSKQVYEVPADYFEQLPAQVLNTVKAQPAKVVSISFTRRIMKYAAAAVVAGIIVVAGWMYMGKGGNTVVPGKTDASVVTNEPTPPELQQISDEVLEKYLENQTAAPVETTAPATNSNNADIDASDMKNMLADVSDEDLQQYLEKYSTTKDIQTN